MDKSLILASAMQTTSPRQQKHEKTTQSSTKTGMVFSPESTASRSQIQLNKIDDK